MNLKKEIVGLREQHNWLTERKAEKAKESAIRDQEYLSRRADELMRDIFKALNEMVDTSAGLGSSVILSAGCHSSDNVPEVRMLVEERCGLKVKWVFPGSADAKTRDMVRIDLHDEVKAYELTTMEFEDGAKVQRQTLLDFPALFEENQRLNQIWAQEVDNVAREVIDECKRCLSQMDDKHYGIQNKTKMTNKVVWSWFDSASFAFDSGRVEYACLTDRQLKKLKQTVDRIISGGEIRFWHDSDSKEKTLWVTLVRQPDKVVEDSYYDYQKFCQKYDVVTDALQEIFDKILADLKLTDPEKQINALAPQRVLYFDFAEYEWQQYFNYGRVANGLAGRGHEQSLIDAVNQKFQAIHVTEMCFSKREKGSMDKGKIEFKYVITEPLDDFIKEQVAAEEMIQHIKARRVTYIARVVAEVLLADVKETGVMRLFENGYPTREYYHTELNEISLDGKALGHSVSLEHVTDEDFIKRVEREVNRLTDGVLMVNIKRRNYKLNFDKSEASAEHPITLDEYTNRFLDRVAARVRTEAEED